MDLDSWIVIEDNTISDKTFSRNEYLVQNGNFL